MCNLWQVHYVILGSEPQIDSKSFYVNSPVTISTSSAAFCSWAFSRHFLSLASSLGPYTLSRLTLRIFLFCLLFMLLAMIWNKTQKIDSGNINWRNKLNRETVHVDHTEPDGCVKKSMSTPCSSQYPSRSPNNNHFLSKSEEDYISSRLGSIRFLSEPSRSVGRIWYAVNALSIGPRSLSDKNWEGLTGSPSLLMLNDGKKSV